MSLLVNELKILLLVLGFEISLQDTYCLEFDSLWLLFYIANHEYVANNSRSQIYIVVKFEVLFSKSDVKVSFELV